MDKCSEDLIAYLKGLPENYELKWDSHHMSLEKPWAGSWVDVVLEYAAMEILRVGWVWTIVHVGDKDAEPEAAWVFAVQPDLDIWSVWDDATMWYTNEITVPLASLPSKKKIKALRKAGKRNHSKPMSHHAWSLDCITNALKGWIETYAQRGDISVVFAPGAGYDPMFEKAVQTLERIKSGEETTYKIGENMEASGQAMDFLLANPDDAPIITEAIGEIARQANPPDEKD